MARMREQIIDTRRQLRRSFACGIALVLPFLIPAMLVAQETKRPVYVTGNAAVTGFSGAVPPIQIAPGVDPAEKTMIDLNGASLRVVDLRHMGGQPAAQLIGAPKPYTATAASIGQVFGVAIDDNIPPNIYAAASSAYGLPIAAKGSDGQFQHIRIGAPNATFVPGLWGPHGGPGSIWKIDGTTGAVSLFATVTQSGEANSGAALGGLAYDSASKSLYVADRESGVIHRFGLNGRELGLFDHGLQGREAQGLPAVRWTSRQGVDPASPRFDSTQPATWNYAAPERRVFGLAVHQQRLYYAVADGLQIWSVGLGSDGGFQDDAMIELAVPPSSGPTEIARITFDEQDRMFLGERAAPTGAFDFEALAVPAIGRVLRYAVVRIVNGHRVWQEEPADYGIGFPGDYRNTDGGVAIGYSYDARGDLDPGSCGGFMWTTGEDLRHPLDASLAARLAQSGALDVSGLQGNGTWLAGPTNKPPLKSYFIAYVDNAADPVARGHMGDITIQRNCRPVRQGAMPPLRDAQSGTGAPQPPPGRSPPTPPPPPPGLPRKPPGGCSPDQLRRVSDNSCVPSCERPDVQVGGNCCAPGLLAAGGDCSNGSCPAGQTAIGPSNFCCNSGQVYTGANGAPACCPGQVVNGQCQNIPVTPTNPDCTPGSTNPQCCPSGYVATGTSCCLADKVTSKGVCCASGDAPSGPNKSECLPIIRIPPGQQCCGKGLIPAGDGQCCAPGNITTTGTCCTSAVNPADRSHCPINIQLVPQCAAGYTRMQDGSCCNNRFVGADGHTCNTKELPCATGEFRAPGGTCEPVQPPPCPAGRQRDEDGDCVRSPRPTACPRGTTRDRHGQCEDDTPPPPPPVVRRHREPPTPPPPPPGPRRPRPLPGAYGPPPYYYGGRPFMGPYGGRMFMMPGRGPMGFRRFGGFRRF
jgi:hypothetical protein